MDDVTKKLLLEWIYENHDHHSATKEAKNFPVKVRKNGKWETIEDVEYVEESTCFDGDSPYVNSLDLEAFVKTL